MGCPQDPHRHVLTKVVDGKPQLSSIDVQPGGICIITEQLLMDLLEQLGWTEQAALGGAAMALRGEQCPECRQGKHPNCTEQVPDGDELVPCPCASLNHPEL